VDEVVEATLEVEAVVVPTCVEDVVCEEVAVVAMIVGVVVAVVDVAALAGSVKRSTL